MGGEVLPIPRLLEVDVEAEACCLASVPQNWKSQLSVNIYSLLAEQVSQAGWNVFHSRETKVCVKIMFCSLRGCQEKGNDMDQLNL